MDKTVLKNKFGFAAYPSVRLKGEKTTRGKTTFANLKELLFGDYIKVYTNNKGKAITRDFTVKGETVTYVKVRARGKDGFVKPEDILPNRVLEVNFVDIGQGDGCHIVTPDDRHFLVDAGQSDNMYRFLKWRFNLTRGSKAPPPFTVIVSHSDADHYKGFQKIFTRSNATKQQFNIQKVYHNGMVELTGTDAGSLGTQITLDGKSYITDLVDSAADYRKRARADGAAGYIKVLEMTEAPKESLRTRKDKFLYSKKNMTMEVLGPVAAEIDGKDALPVFKSNKGKTKNGHSVMLMLTIGNFRIFLGGDLNSEAEDYLLMHYTGTDFPALRKELAKKTLKSERRKEILEEIEQAIEKARTIFQCDVAKSCHHGSSDFTTEFLRALNPIATIISSGDEEPHCHPRPDTLGTIGKHSRGNRSLIFSTELSRSTKEFVEVAKIKKGASKERTVTVYGMINVRTDGEKAIIAQKLERPAPRGDWDIQEIVWDNQLKEFVYGR